MMKNSKILLDTNFLIYHTFEDFDREKHLKCINFLNKIYSEYSEVYISNQILREFFAISTNSKFFDIPLSIDEVIIKIEEFKSNFYIVFENEKSLNILIKLIKEYSIIKQKIHDTNIVATMLANEIDTIATFNVKDFKNFEDIKIRKL